MRVVRSSIASGRLLDVDLEAARRCPGVVGAFSARELEAAGPFDIPVRISAPQHVDKCLQPALARTRVNYVGEPIAVVVATDPYIAEDAAGGVWAEIDESEPVLDPLAALTAPPLHEGLESNVVGIRDSAFGEDIDGALQRSEVIIRRRFSSQRHTAVPMETRGLVADSGDGGRLTIWGATKVKHFNRKALAALFGSPEDHVRMIETETGGSFGVRGELYPEDILVSWLTLTLGRPVKWVEDRAEHLVATNHSREHIFDVTLGATSDGRFVALRAEVFSSIGAYVRTTGMKVTELATAHLAGPYSWPAIHVTGKAVLTNKTPMGTYRGPGEVEPTFVRERMIDELAGELGLDPASVRERNLAREHYEPSPHPIERPLLDEKGQAAAPRRFRKVLDRARYTRRLDDAPVNSDYLYGTGIACYQDEGGYGPHEEARIAAEADGSFTIYLGVASVGQGVGAAMARILADIVGIETTRISVNHHDTDAIPEGFGTFASRTTVVAGNAVALAADDLRRQARAAGASLLGVLEDDVDVVEDRVLCLNGRGITMGEMQLEGQGCFRREGIDVSFCTAVATVRIDRRTGRVDPLTYVVGCDVGRAVNPLALEGQLVGAAVQGIGGALLEELVYDDRGQPLATSLMDYLLPTISEIPYIDTLTFEEGAANPLGAKGAGEAGIIGAAAALSNAVADALGSAGSNVDALPLSPERVHAFTRRAEALQP